MRRFELQRDEDATGVSGIGTVAQGIEFDDGTCVLRWLTQTSSTAVYTNANHIQAIHGHEGRTRLVWLDSAERVPVTVTFVQGCADLSGLAQTVGLAGPAQTQRQIGRREKIIERLRRPT